MHNPLPQFARARLLSKLALILTVLLFGLATSPELKAAAGTFDTDSSAHGVPLAQMLTPDGNLNLPPGFSGSLDPHGWALASGAGEAPRFVPRVPGDDKWVGFGATSGVNGTVDALAADGSGNLFVAGSFSSAGNTLAASIAKWDGTSWSSLGYGLGGSSNATAVFALAWDSAHQLLYAGGNFTRVCADVDCGSGTIQANRVAKWNGSSWSVLGNAVNGVNSTVRALAIGESGNIYVGGEFTGYCSVANCSSTTTANHVAKWNNGTLTWSVLGFVPNGVNNSVFALAWDSTHTRLFVGGSFTAAAGAWANHIAMYFPGPNTWAPLALGSNYGVSGLVYALALDSANNWLYVGGDFRYFCANSSCAAWGTRINHLARWDNSGGTGWFALNYGVSGPVRALAVIGGNLFAAGDLESFCTGSTCVTSSPARHIAKWVSSGGGSWWAVGSGTDYATFALLEGGGDLYIGGGFFVAGGVAATGIAKIDLASGTGLALAAGNGAGDRVDAVAIDRYGNVYIGGDFRTVGNVIINNIARWNTASGSWSALENGLEGAVSSLLISSDGTLYVVGDFTYVCNDVDCISTTGQRVNHIAKWTPTGSSGTWSGVGYGVRGSVLALALDQAGTLYAGGGFTSRCLDEGCLSEAPAHNIVQFSGGAWSTVGDGVDNEVAALTVDKNNNLYVGGGYTSVCGNIDCTSPGTTVNNIARWNISLGSWSALGNGVNGYVYALAVDSSNNLYAGGNFFSVCGNVGCTADAAIVNHIAKWNAAPATWSAIGNGLDRDVNAIVLDASDTLIVGGYFSRVCEDDWCTGPGTSVNGISLWTGTTWAPLGNGIGPSFNTSVNALSLHAGRLSVGGHFSRAGDKVSVNLAQYIYRTYIDLPLVMHG